MRTRGVGPTPCEYMIVSDYPGKVEDRTGIPLKGKTGDDVNRRLDGFNLPERNEWFITNLIRQWNSDNEYTMSDVVRDEPELLEELHEVQPKVIVTLGRFSARWFLGDVALDEVNAIPWYIPKSSVLHGDDPPVVFPIYNPAAGFRSPEVQSHVDYGFSELALFLDDKIQPRYLFADDYPNPTYIEITDPAWIVGSLQGVTTIYLDSEGHPDRVWSVQICIHPGTAYLLRTINEPVVRAFFDWLITNKPRVVYHGSLHDFSIMRSVMANLGIPIDALYDIPFDDTQIMAYLLQLEPIGLKPNCVRHCGMQMQSYEEVLGHAQLKHATDYLGTLLDAEQADWEAKCHAELERINKTPLRDKQGQVRRTKAGAIRYRKITKPPQLPKTPLHKAAVRVLRSATPFELWQNQNEDILVAAYERLVPDA